MIRVSEENARAILITQICRFTGIHESVAESASSEILDRLRVADQQARWPAFTLKSDGSYCCYHYASRARFSAMIWFAGLAVSIRLDRLPARFWLFPGDR